MALMVAINVAVMIYKSISAARRKQRLTAIKKRKLAKHAFDTEVKQINEVFDINYGMAEAMKQWRKNNKRKSRRHRDKDNQIEVKV